MKFHCQTNIRTENINFPLQTTIIAKLQWTRPHHLSSLTLIFHQPMMYHQTRPTPAMKHLKWRRSYIKRNPSKLPSNSMSPTPHSVFGKPYWIRTTIHCTLHCQPFSYRKHPNNHSSHCWNLPKRNWTWMRLCCACAKIVWIGQIWYEHFCSSVSSRWVRNHHWLHHKIRTTICSWFTTLRSRTMWVDSIIGLVNQSSETFLKNY